MNQMAGLERTPFWRYFAGMTIMKSLIKAFRDFFDSYDTRSTTEKLNDVYASEDSSLDPALLSAQIEALRRDSDEPAV
jgi:hypothetical protein